MEEQKIKPPSLAVLGVFFGASSCVSVVDMAEAGDSSWGGLGGAWLGGSNAPSAVEMRSVQMAEPSETKASEPGSPTGSSLGDKLQKMKWVS